MDDPEPFLKLMQSALQRRKSRAGSALENHLELVFAAHGVTYTRYRKQAQARLHFSRNSHYRDKDFPSARLTMLASKSTCKDRWRQILNEAVRTPLKHLITLEPSISVNQTTEMQAENVQLVIPAPIHDTYTPAQRTWLVDVENFLSLVRERQAA